MLHLKTFGELSVDIDGTPGSGAAQQRKTLALLALLAASGRRGLSRDKLIAALWPETDAEHGRGLLKQACYALRRDLQSRELFLGSIQLRLNPAVISSDVESFTAALQGNDLRAAVSCYTAPFLDGFYLNGGGEFEEWAESERAVLARQFRTALQTLSADASARGDYRAAAEDWRRLLELEPLSSPAALGLMSALDAAGEHAEALRRGEAHEQLLRSELGCEPPTELSEWIEQHRHVAGNGAARNGSSLIYQPPAPGPADALMSPVAVPRRSLVRVSRWGAVLGLAAVTTAGIVLSGSRTNLATDPDLLAVAPFDVLDPALQIWHEGLVDVLSRDLDGAGPLHTVPQSVAIKRWHGRADRVSAEEFGHSNGAGLVVFGSVRKTRDTVTLRATVLDLARHRAEPDFEVKGGVGDVGDLADTLGVKVLQMLGRDRAIGSVQQVSIGSRSLPALKAFLYGEQFYRRGLWDSALVYYDQAIAQDSTFGLAYRRMNLALSWGPLNASAYRSDEDYLRAAVRLSRGLSPKDSMLMAVDSFLIAADEATETSDLIRFKYRALSTLEEAARRYPGDPEVWLDLGEARFHQPAPLGGAPAPALAAFDRATAIDSGFTPAYEHMVRLAIRLNRPELARKYAAAYLRLNPTDVAAPSIRLAALLLDPSRSHSPETEQMIDSASAPVLFSAGLWHLGWWADSDETSIRVARAMALRSGTGADPWTDTLMYPQYLAIALGFRGHLREAYAVDRRLMLDPSASRFGYFLDPFHSLSVLGVIPESLAETTFRGSFTSGKAWPMPASDITARQLRGLPWWLARRDTASLAQFARRAERESRTQTTAHGKLQGRYLHAAATAYLALARADSVGALRLFQAIPDTLCIENDCYYGKLTEARLLSAAGKADQAAAVLDGWVWQAGGPLFVMGVLERGRIAEDLGDRQKARESFQFVVDVWRYADPELEPYVREARVALQEMPR